MPGFSYSPTMMGQLITLTTKSGNELTGRVREVNPAEVVLELINEDKLLRVNRDQIDAYTGSDDVKRKPDPLRLHVTRCFNIPLKCNGVKKLTIDPQNIGNFTECPVRNEFCECATMDFFDLQKQAQIKLLKDLTVGEYPQTVSKDEV